MAEGENAALDRGISGKAEELRRTAGQRIATATGQNEVSAAHELGGDTRRGRSVVDDQVGAEERLQRSASWSNVELEGLDPSSDAIPVVDVPVAEDAQAATVEIDQTVSANHRGAESSGKGGRAGN